MHIGMGKVEGVDDVLASLRGAPILDVARRSPQLALALAWGTDFGPYGLSCSAKFVDPAVLTLDPVALEAGKTRITQPWIIEAVDTEIDIPDLNPGALEKPEQDFYFALQSGIKTTLLIEGGPGYSVFPFFEPIRNLNAALFRTWPKGWILGYTQTIIMQFQQTIPLPDFPVFVTTTFMGWQPVGTTKYMNMTATDAFTELRKVLKDQGYDPSKVDAALDSIQNSPTWR